MSLTRFLQDLTRSVDGKLAEPARKWLDLSFLAVFFCMAFPLIIAPVARLAAIPFWIALFLPQVLLGGILTWLLFRVDTHVAPRVKLQLFKLQPFPFLMMFKALFTLIFCTIIISAATMKIADFMGCKLPQQPLVLFLMKANGIQTIFIMISAVIIAPILEEWSFRRVIFGKFATVVSCPLAMILTSVIFSLMHGNLLHAPSLFFMGMILQAVMRRTSSILCPVILHAAFNLVNIIMILYTVYGSGGNLN